MPDAGYTCTDLDHFGGGIVDGSAFGQQCGQQCGSRRRREARRELAAGVRSPRRPRPPRSCSTCCPRSRRQRSPGRTRLPAADLERADCPGHGVADHAGADHAGPISPAPISPAPISPSPISPTPIMPAAPIAVPVTQTVGPMFSGSLIAVANRTVAEAAGSDAGVALDFRSISIQQSSGLGRAVRPGGGIVASDDRPECQADRAGR